MTYLNVQFPTGSGRDMTLSEVVPKISRQLQVFLRAANGRRPVCGRTAKFQEYSC